MMQHADTSRLTSRLLQWGGTHRLLLPSSRLHIARKASVHRLHIARKASVQATRGQQ